MMIIISYSESVDIIIACVEREEGVMRSMRGLPKSAQRCTSDFLAHSVLTQLLQSTVLLRLFLVISPARDW